MQKKSLQVLVKKKEICMVYDWVHVQTNVPEVQRYLEI